MKRKENNGLALGVLIFCISTIAVGTLMMVIGLIHLTILAELRIENNATGWISMLFLVSIFFASSILCATKIAMWLYEPVFNFVGDNSFFSVSRRKR